MTFSIFTASGSGCVGQVAEFEGRAGVFVAGSVLPALSGVKVTVFTIVKDGDEERPPINVETDKEGKYRLVAVAVSEGGIDIEKEIVDQL